MGEAAASYTVRATLYSLQYPFLAFREFVVAGFFNCNLLFFSSYYTPKPKLAAGAYVLAFSEERPPVEMVVPAFAVRFFFDLDGDGDGEKISWINKKGMVIFYDINGNNFLDNSEELLGVKDKEPWRPLIALDSNKDSILDRRDSAFSKLRLLWDKNGNQKFSRSEIFKVSEKIRFFLMNDVSPIVANVKADFIDPKTGQSTPLYLLSYFTSYIPVVMSNGRNGIVLHMTFEQTAQHPFPTLQTKLGSDANAASIISSFESFPNLRGFGDVADLWAEMHGDPVLKKMVSDLSSQTSEALFSDIGSTSDQIESLLMRWGQVQNVDPYSRGWFIDARTLTLLEKLEGKDIYTTTDLAPVLDRALLLKDKWKATFRVLRARFLLQTDVGRKIFPEGVLYQKDAQDILIKGSLSEEYLSHLAQESQTLAPEDRRIIYEIVSDMSALQISMTDRMNGEMGGEGNKDALNAKNKDVLSKFQKLLFP